MPPHWARTAQSMGVAQYGDYIIAAGAALGLGVFHFPGSRTVLGLLSRSAASMLTKREFLKGSAAHARRSPLRSGARPGPGPHPTAGSSSSGSTGSIPSSSSGSAGEGKLPHFADLMARGDFRPLGTTVPPLSPVAWATFTTGMNPGGHGIFDFVHRDPATMVPYLSTTKAEAPARTIKIGNWVVPLSSGSITLLREGKAFWQVLQEHGIPTTVVHAPANFPPSPARASSSPGWARPTSRAPTGCSPSTPTIRRSRMAGDTGGRRGLPRSSG